MSLTKDDLSAIKGIVDESIESNFENKVKPFVLSSLSEDFESKVKPFVREALDDQFEHQTKPYVHDAVEELAISTARGFAENQKRFEEIDKRFDGIDTRLVKLEVLFEQMNGKLDSIVEYVRLIPNMQHDDRQLELRVDDLEKRTDHLEAKLL